MRFHFFILASSLLLWHAYALPLRPHAVHDPPVHNTPLSQKNIDPPSAVLQRCNGALSETSILGTSTLNQNSDGPKSNIDFPRVPSSDAAIQPHTANRVGIRRALSKTAQKKQANAERRKENRKAAKADVKQRIAAMPAMPGEQQARKSLQNAKKGAFDRKKGVYSSSNSNKAKKAVGKAQAAVAPFDAARKQKALSDRKKQQSQRTIDLKAAAAEYGKITNKPQRNSKFKVKGDTTSNKPERVASGKDVRAAIFASQYKPATEKSRLKPFKNAPHEKSDGITQKPIQHLPTDRTGTRYKETTLSPALNAEDRKNDHKTQPMRVVLGQGPNGSTKFEGVISHDQSRAATGPGANDHFWVKPEKSSKKN